MPTTAVPPAPPHALARRAQVAVVAVFTVHGLLFASWAAHIPHVKARLGLDDGGLGVALLGTPLGSVAAIALTVRLVPRLGSRRVVQGALLGYCAAGPLVGLTGSLLGLMAALFLWGLFQGMLDVSMNTQAIAVEGARNRQLMNGFHAWWSVGSFAGAGAGTLGVALGVGLSPQLLVLGVPALVVAGLLTARMLTDRAEPGRPETTPSGTTEPGAPQDGPVRPARRLSRGMVALGAIAFAAMLCEGSAADWSSVYLRDSAGGGAAAAGLGYTGFALAMFLVRAGGDRLVVRVPVHRLLPVLAGAAAVLFAAALAAGTVPLGVAGFVALGFGLGAIVPSAFSAAGRLPGIHPGVGVAGVSGLGWAGFVFGPPVIGQLANLTSLRVALGLVPLLVGAVALGCARIVALRVPPVGTAPVGTVPPGVGPQA